MKRASLLQISNNCITLSDGVGPAASLELRVVSKIVLDEKSSKMVGKVGQTRRRNMQGLNTISKTGFVVCEEALVPLIGGKRASFHI